MKTARLLAPLVTFLALLASAAAQTVVELRSDARVAAGAPVRLGDVAQITGEGADALAALAVLGEAPAADAAIGGAISIAHVRRTIAGSGEADLSTLTLRGSACRLLVVAPPAAEAGEGPAAGASDAPAPANAAPPAPALPGGRVRDAVVAKLAQTLGVAESDLRVSFDAEDADLLDLALAGRLAEVRPVGSSERLPVAVTLYEQGPGGARIAASRTIRAGVLVRRPVAIAAAALRRGEVIGPEDITPDVQWLDPNARPVPAEAAAGAAVRSRLRAGQLIEQGDIEPAVVVRKGEIVSIHCPAGTVVLRTAGRALADGREGEVVEFEPADRPARRGERRTFYARMNGPGRAVAVAGTELPE